jgi:hypothetical protein
LPTEIILLIGSFVTHRTLHKMSAVCRRLADIIIPLYLRHFDINIPSTDAPYTTITLTTVSQCKALLVWRRSSVFRKISSTLVIFSEDMAEAAAQVVPLREFFLFLGSFVFTERLVFYFPENIAEASIALLNVVSGCKYLSIRSMGDLPHCRTIRLPYFASQKPVGSSAAYSITSLALSQLAFTKPFLIWTIAALTRTRLTSLDLEDLELSTSQLRHLLHNINIPTLRRICLPSSVPIAALSLFLQRHRSISSLDINETSNSGFPRSARATRALRADLPSLTSLSGPATILILILDVLQPSQISTATVYPDPEGLNRQALHNLVNHPSCAKLVNLSITLSRDASNTGLLFDANELDVANLPELYMLTLSAGRDQSIFSEDMMVGQADA